MQLLEVIDVHRLIAGGRCGEKVFNAMQAGLQTEDGCYILEWFFCRFAEFPDTPGGNGK